MVEYSYVAMYHCLHASVSYAVLVFDYVSQYIHSSLQFFLFLVFIIGVEIQFDTVHASVIIIRCNN